MSGADNGDAGRGNESGCAAGESGAVEGVGGSFCGERMSIGEAGIGMRTADCGFADVGTANEELLNEGREGNAGVLGGDLVEVG